MMQWCITQFNFFGITGLFEDRNKASMESHLDNDLWDNCSADDERVFKPIANPSDT